MKFSTILEVAFIILCLTFVVGQTIKQRELNKAKIHVGDLVTVIPSVDDIMRGTEISKACDTAKVMAIADVEDKHVAWVIARNCNFQALGKSYTYINLITTIENLERAPKNE